MMRFSSFLMLSAIALTLTSCVGEPDGLRQAVPAGAGGYAPAQPNSAPAPVAPMAPPPAIPTVNLMIDDPEADTTTWTEDVPALEITIARKKCEAMAEAYTQNGGTRVILKKLTKNSSGKSYKCEFEGEN
jgi:PBP1b-binding outer membrane lipoprotein LpoB